MIKKKKSYKTFGVRRVYSAGGKKKLFNTEAFRMERMSTLTLETRNDLHLTSTGVAHSIRQQPPENSIKVGIVGNRSVLKKI